jgi:hypothetical protein
MLVSLRVLVASALFLLAACVSQPLRIPSAPIGPNEEAVGEAQGSSTGIMLFQFIPIGQNDRFQKAYDAAVANSGGTRLTNVTVQERWFWAWVLNGYIFSVKGTGVRAK